VSDARVNYEVRRKDKQSSSSSTSAEVLVVRGKDFNQKSKGVRRRSKSRPKFRDLKKNHCTFCKDLGHWKVDCPKIKDKNQGKESKTEANLTQVINIQLSYTSQVDGSDSDSSLFSFSVATPTIGY